MKAVAAVLISFLTWSAFLSAGYRFPNEGAKLDSPVRQLPVGRARGDGVHYPWMDMMRQRGVRRALALTQFKWQGRPTEITVTQVLYFSKYEDDCAQISEPSRLKEIRNSGLEQQLQQAATERTAKAHIAPGFDQPVKPTARGVCQVELLDDESLSVTTPWLAPLSKDRDSLMDYIGRADEAGLEREVKKGVSPQELSKVLWMAVIANEPCITRDLLKAGANANTIYEAGQTPLMLAVASRNIAIVKILLEAGASVSMRNRTGASAVSIAKRNGDSQIVQVLKQAGAK